MSVKISVIAAVASMETVDLSIMRMAFPASYVHDSQKVEFDVYEGGREIALKGNFAEQSNVVNKDGYKTITVNPIQVNESIVDAVKNLNKKRIGDTPYGTAEGKTTDAEKRAIEDDAKGFGKLKKRSQRLIKKSMYDVLTTGKIIVSGENNAEDEIDYGLTNIIVNDNATAGQYQWNDTTNSNPIEQLETEAESMGQFAVDTYVLGLEAKKAFVSHPKVSTIDNTTTGKKANFIQASKEERASKSTEYMVYLGSTTGNYGKAVELYYEFEQYVIGNTEYNYLDKNYVVGFRYGNEENGQVQYGNIPVATGDGEGATLDTYVGMEWIDGEIRKDPAGVKRYYRSSPLPTMNQPKAYISIKATLIA